MQAAERTTGDTGARPIEEIVITAQQVDATITDTFHSVEVFDAHTIARSTDLSFDDLLVRLPNVEIDPVYGVIVRGSPEKGFGGDLPNQLNLIDGAWTPGVIHFWDVDHVEILRGGQSSVGSASGATFGVKYRPADLAWNGKLHAGASSRADEAELGFALGGPIVADRLGFRVSGYHRDNDGVVKNTLRRESDWSGFDEDFLNARLLFKTGKGEFTVEYVELDQDYGAPPWINQIGADGSNAFRRETAIETPVGTSLYQRDLHVRYRAQLTERLHLHAIVGDHRWRSNQIIDRDNQPSPVCPPDCSYPGSGFEQERQLNRATGAGAYLDYDLGAWTLHGAVYSLLSDVNGERDFHIPLDFDGQGALPGVDWRLRFRFPTDHWWTRGVKLNSIYTGSRLTFSATLGFDSESADNIRTTGGLRTSSTGIAPLDAAYDGFIAATPQVDDKDNYSASSVVPMAALSYAVTERIAVGAKAERSFRRGWDRINGYQRRTVPYGRETATDYDVFLRAQSATGRWYANVNGFMSDIRDQQIDFCFSANFLDCHIVNAGHTRKYGLELDSWLQAGALNAWIGASLLKAEFKSFDVPGYEGYLDRPVPNAPKWKLSTGLTYDSGTLFWSADVTARPGTPGEVTASTIKNEGRVLVNGRLGYRFDHALEISLWGRNLLNEHYFDRLEPDAPGAYVGAPRAVGFAVTKEWGP